MAWGRFKDLESRAWRNRELKLDDAIEKRGLLSLTNQGLEITLGPSRSDDLSSF